MYAIFRNHFVICFLLITNQQNLNKIEIRAKRTVIFHSTVVIQY